MSPFDPDLACIPAAYREDAEEVRAHLVMVRGGAPFLSSRDAITLLGWLEDAVPVVDILRAIERAADARRKRPSRLPFGLGQAKRHLGKPSSGWFERSKIPAEGGRAELIARLLAQSSDDPQGPALAELAHAIGALPGQGDPLIRQAVALCRGFMERAWADLPAPERQRRVNEARASLRDFEELLDEAALMAQAEELARDTIRQAYPLLELASLWELLSQEI